MSDPKAHDPLDALVPLARAEEVLWSDGEAVFGFLAREAITLLHRAQHADHMSDPPEAWERRRAALLAEWDELRLTFPAQPSKGRGGEEGGGSTS